MAITRGSGRAKTVERGDARGVDAGGGSSSPSGDGSGGIVGAVGTGGPSDATGLTTRSAASDSSGAAGSSGTARNRSKIARPRSAGSPPPSTTGAILTFRASRRKDAVDVPCGTSPQRSLRRHPGTAREPLRAGLRLDENGQGGRALEGRCTAETELRRPRPPVPAPRGLAHDQATTDGQQRCSALGGDRRRPERAGHHG